MSWAIVAGSGLQRMAPSGERALRRGKTPYGDCFVLPWEEGDRRAWFLPRHGPGHRVPPHRINYRANIWGLHQLGVTRVLAASAVGSLDPSLKPGSLVLVEQFIDFTRTRPRTFFDEDRVHHQDMTHPYCPELSHLLRDQARALKLDLRAGAVYVCTEGPRYETAAEVRAFRLLGGTVVGMTAVPEVVLARELGMCFALVGVVTNLAAGLTEAPLSHAEVVARMSEQQELLRRLLWGVIATADEERRCTCGGK